MVVSYLYLMGKLVYHKIYIPKTNSNKNGNRSAGRDWINEK